MTDCDAIRVASDRFGRRVLPDTTTANGRVSDAESSLHSRSLQRLSWGGSRVARSLPGVGVHCPLWLRVPIAGSVKAILPQRASQAIVNTCVLTITARSSHHVLCRITT